MPITPEADTANRLLDLQQSYDPREIVVLGDIVHRAVALDVLEEEMRSLWAALSPRASQQVRIGNYERLFDAARRNVRAWEAAHPEK